MLFSRSVNAYRYVYILCLCMMSHDVPVYLYMATDHTSIARLSQVRADLLQQSLALAEEGDKPPREPQTHLNTEAYTEARERGMQQKGCGTLTNSGLRPLPFSVYAVLHIEKPSGSPLMHRYCGRLDQARYRAMTGALHSWPQY